MTVNQMIFGLTIWNMIGPSKAQLAAENMMNFNLKLFLISILI